MVDIFEEFIMEFGDLRYIAMIQGVPPFTAEIVPTRDAFTKVSRHTLTANTSWGLP